MARFVSLLFFLSLNLCEYRILRSGGSPLTLKAPVELECVISGPGLSDSGVSWMRQLRDSAPQFILFVTSLGRVAPTDNGKPPERFDARRENKNYRLTVKSFQEQDQGNYYCIVKHNQRLHFSSGIPLHLPGQHQPHPISAPSAWAGAPAFPLPPSPASSLSSSSPLRPGPFFLCAQVGRGQGSLYRAFCPGHPSQCFAFPKCLSHMDSWYLPHPPSPSLPFTSTHCL
uniref:T-cell surface glycoprotein CD8 alpha chain n=1 Tax=Chrysemys picta bellii TaxID=8478 RepID=A0A8C3FEQ1_CHRPI